MVPVYPISGHLEPALSEPCHGSGVRRSPGAIPVFGTWLKYLKSMMYAIYRLAFEKLDACK